MRRIALFVLAVFLIVFTSSAVAATEWAKVNGKVITDKDVELALSGVNEGQRANILKDINSRKQVLSKLIDQEILAQTAEKEKLDQDQDFKDAISFFRKQYLANRLLQKNLKSQLTDKAAKNYYDAHKNRYSTDQVHVQHILLADEDKAKEVLNKAKAPNTDFQELAEKMSRDPSAKNNRGDIGMINRDSPFVQEFKDAAFRAKKGEIVGPVKTAFGYHVIKVVEKKPGKPLEYDEVEMRVKQEMQHDVVNAYVSKLKQTAKIQVEEKTLK